ncbi:cadherin-2-like [Sander lucioperca]|uniref:cadherin-2-like n=1 Tax=Sander lucioperca TaxID=283035 RepID=UPI001653D4A4|nr:cadherin-2-like [Sander lucioperca]
METIQLSLLLMLCLGVYISSSEMLKRQKRNWIIDSFSIDEDYKGVFPYTLGKISVMNKFVSFKINGQGADEEPKGILQINKITGELTVHGPVDYEKFKVLKLVCMAYDKENHVIDTNLGIEILINDANDNPPKFDHDMYNISIPEATSQGTAVITINARDVDTKENNTLFDFKIVSDPPLHDHDLEFYLTQVSETATISFKGCLNHEKAEKYTIIVEAKDRGEQIQLASSCTVIIHIEDGNNHLPLITGHTGPGRVKEGEENVLVSRLQVTDKDSKGTAAWRAKYRIQEDANNNFRITTDPETNDGLLYVKTHLDYEDSPLKNVTISVENEIPFGICKVVRRHTTGLWEVVTIGGATIGGATGTETHSLSTCLVTVIVENVNEPPIFDAPNKQVTLVENVKVGHYLVTFTARDPDVTSANTLVYIKGNDPADWVTVDPKTGKITTSKIIDRESSFVKDNIYNVTICAVENGQPPMTGTATLHIYIIDENDNAPSLAVNTIDMCQSDGLSLANIVASDPDEEPYGGPLTFELQEKEKGKWKLDTRQEYSVNLVKKPTVPSGQYELLLEVFDHQGLKAVHNLSVTVCDCVDRPNCRIRKATGSAVRGGVLVVIFFAMLLLAGMLLLAFLVLCKEKSIAIPDDDSGQGQQLMNCNTEKLGTDCKVMFEPLDKGYEEQSPTKSQVAVKRVIVIKTIHLITSL